MKKRLGLLMLSILVLTSLIGVTNSQFTGLKPYDGPGGEVRQIDIPGCCGGDKQTWSIAGFAPRIGLLVLIGVIVVAIGRIMSKIPNDKKHIVRRGLILIVSMLASFGIIYYYFIILIHFF